MKANKKYQVNDTLTIYTGDTVVVRKVITSSILRVSYGFDAQGNDIVGLINVNIHLLN